MKYLFFSVILSLVLIACNIHTSQSEENLQQVLPEEKIQEVKITPLKSQSFKQELISNGKLVSKEMVGLKFKTNERISDIYVKNGDFVRKGQIIAKLQNFSFNNRLQQANEELKRSKLDLQDQLIGQGFKLKDTLRVPKATMELLKVKSGYNRAKRQYEMAQYEYQNSVLYAPISGIVANLTNKPNTYPDTSKDFCNIVNLHKMEATFPILESELDFVRKGDVIMISPFSMPNVKIKGKIYEINPWVDENGMIQLKASAEYHPKIVEGMGVRIHIFRELEKQWVIPKSAVVLRTNREVVFTVKGNKAYWNYVQVGQENATEYTITSETLNEGDQIIINGNINLAHESPIKVVD